MAHARAAIVPRPGAFLGTIAIVAGALIALIGLGSWLIADPRGDAARQIVATLWALCGLLGLFIALTGGALISIEHAILGRPIK